jgi:hypothetical protein
MTRSPYTLTESMVTLTGLILAEGFDLVTLTSVTNGITSFVERALEEEIWLNVRLWFEPRMAP